MLVVHVRVHVKDSHIRDFIKATLENARDSILEPGIARFDVIQSQEEASRFLLVEVYRTQNAPAEHKATDHYKKWKDTVEGMMAEPRISEKYTFLFPEVC